MASSYLAIICNCAMHDAPPRWTGRNAASRSWSASRTFPRGNKVEDTKSVEMLLRLELRSTR
jgi:hypothetical protein